MADLTKRIIFIVLYWISDAKLISADYCEWNLCTPQEECCGPNKCCPKAVYHISEIFDIIGWICAGFVFLLIFCGGFFKFKNELFRICFKPSGDKQPLTGKPNFESA